MRPSCTERDQQIIQSAEQGESLEQIAARVGLKVSRVTQIVRTARLREQYKQKFSGRV